MILMLAPKCIYVSRFVSSYIIVSLDICVCWVRPTFPTKLQNYD